MPFHLPPPVPSFDLTLASHGMSKGISYTDGPQVIPRILIKAGSLQAGALWKNISSTLGASEAQLFVGWSGKVDGLNLGAMVARRMITEVTNRRADIRSWEFTATGAYKFGKVVGLKATVVYSPDDLGAARRSIYVEAGPTVALPESFVASAAIGRRDRVGAPKYTSYNAGVSTTVAKRMTMDLRYYGTDRHNLGYVYASRLVGSVKVAF